MKVLHIINSLNYGGAEKLLSESLPLYKKKGIDVSLLTLNNADTSLKDNLVKNGVEVYSVYKYKNIYNPIYIIKLIPFLKKNDVIHVHLFPTLYWVALASLFIKNKPKLILTEHNTENRRRRIPLLKYVDKIMYKKYTSIIAISEGTKTNLQKHLGKSFNNIVTINNGINLLTIKSAVALKKENFNLFNDEKIIIQVSSFTNQKDQSTLIKALSALSANTHLFLVGDGPLKKDCMELTNALSLSKRVHFLGYRSDVPSLLKMADISVLSSHYEGFGLAIVEGMAAGNACVGSNVPGLSEVLKDAGIMFKVNDAQELSKIISNLTNDKDFYDRIAIRCKERADKFDINVMIDKYIKNYN